MSSKKILFWIEEPFIDFGIAKYLKKNLETELYSIIICNNNSKKFFETQKLVEFKKNWFYRDSILLEKQKIDLDYLTSLEKTLGLHILKMMM